MALWLPGLLAVACTFIPAYYLAVRSTERGWAPWQRALETSVPDLLQRSLMLAAVVGLSSIAVSVPAAWLTTRGALPFRRAWSVLLALPLAIPSYIIALAVVAFLGPKGTLQVWLEPLGVDRLPEIYGFWGAAFTLTCASYPYVYLVVRASLASADSNEEEASRSLGESPFATFRKVTLPALIPAIAAGVLLSILYTLSDFGAVSLLRYSTFTRDIFIEFQSSFDRTGAAVLGSILGLTTALILAAELGIRTFLASGRKRRQSSLRPVPLGRWTVPAVLFLGMIVLLALVMPVGVLVYWLVNGLRANAEFPDLAAAARHSFTMALFGAAITTLVALPLAILAARYGGVLARTAEQAAYLSHALPGLVVALALVFFGIRYATDLYQTVWMLLFAYVILFVPNALSALRASLLRQPANLEDAAASLGRSPLMAVLTVTAPLARPGIAAAFALVFLTVIKELPATLILSPPGYETLPGLVWSRSTDALYAGAALPALVLIGLAAIPIGLLVWKGDVGALES
jgi:iron(III) transport system permease protein